MLAYIKLHFETYRAIRDGRLAGPLVAHLVRSPRPPAVGLIVAPLGRDEEGQGLVVIEGMPYQNQGPLGRLPPSPYVARVRLGPVHASGVMLLAGRPHRLSRVIIYGSPVESIRCQGDPGESQMWKKRFSRTVRALPGTMRTFCRMEEISPLAFVGMGRGGSCLVTSMVQAYPIARRGCLLLIDPDVLEDHALNAHRALPEDLGDSKVTAMARLLGRYGAKTVALNRRVEEAIDWIKHAQLILSWPDNPNARRFVGVLSAAYAVPLIDIGSRVGPAGAGFVDVRTVLPGSGGCFFCLGGAGSNETTAVRTGSLLSVNSIAAGFAMLAFENLMAGLQTASQWIQVDLSRNGGFLAERRQLRGTPTRDCQVCREVGGADAAFTRLLQGHMPG